MESTPAHTTTSSFIHALEKEVLAHPAVQHPFLKRFATEALTLRQVQTFGLQHYQLVRVFVNYMTNLLPKFPDQDGKNLLMPVFMDEFGQWTIFRSHVALYRNFLKALGHQEEDWGRVALLPETSYFIQFHLQLTREKSFLSGLGAIGPGHEFSIPTMFDYLLKGLRKNQALSEEHMEYFAMHIEEDVEHAVIFNRTIDHYARSEADREEVRKGTLLSLSARRKFWDGLHRAVFENQAQG